MTIMTGERTLSGVLYLVVPVMGPGCHCRRIGRYQVYREYHTPGAMEWQLLLEAPDADVVEQFFSGVAYVGEQAARPQPSAAA